MHISHNVRCPSWSAEMLGSLILLKLPSGIQTEGVIPFWDVMRLVPEGNDGGRTAQQL